MGRTRGWRRDAALVAGLLALAACPTGAQAQVGPWGRSPVAPEDPVPLVSPLIAGNPAFSPYWMQGNANGPVDRTTGTLMIASMLSNQTGFGSGRLSGTRGGATTRPRAAEMPNQLIRPGGTAARSYFERGPGAGVGAGRFFNRPNRYFQHNGR